jgi:transcriptional regulator with XRE-family HTH domain
MIIGERLRALREEKHLSQGHEKRTGLLRCYISRVENGHTIPSVETLEKMSRALEIPMYQLFYEGDDVPAPPKTSPKSSRGASGKEARLLRRFCELFSRTAESDSATASAYGSQDGTSRGEVRLSLTACLSKENSR